MARHDGLHVSPDLMTSTVFKHGMFQLALERMIDLVDDMEAKERHIEYIKRGVENEVTDVGEVVYYDPHRIHILDDLLLGHGMLYLYVTDFGIKPDEGKYSQLTANVATNTSATPDSPPPPLNCAPV